MNNITIGQYVPGHSWIYKMDPRVKIFLVIGLIVVLFLIPNIYLMLGYLGLFAIMYLTTGLPIRKMLNGMKPVLFLATFTFILQVLYNQEGTLLYIFNFQIGLYQFLMILGLIFFYFFTKKYMPFKFVYLLIVFVGCFAIQKIKMPHFVWSNYSVKIYDQGLLKGGFILLRIVLMIGLTSMLTFTTMNTEINNGLESLLSPLKLIKINVETISMMISLTLRFIPTLVEETSKIMKAQASRGVDFNEGSIRQKISQIVSLLVPMFVTSFKRAEDLANAMETRGYVTGAKRTKLDLLKLHVIDYISLFVFALLLAGVIVGRIYL